MRVQQWYESHPRAPKPQYAADGSYPIRQQAPSEPQKEAHGCPPLWEHGYQQFMPSLGMRMPQSEQSEPRVHAEMYAAPGPPSSQSLLYAKAHVLLHVPGCDGGGGGGAGGKGGSTADENPQATARKLKGSVKTSPAYSSLLGVPVGSPESAPEVARQSSMSVTWVVDNVGLRERSCAAAPAA